MKLLTILLMIAIILLIHACQTLGILEIPQIHRINSKLDEVVEVYRYGNKSTPVRPGTLYNIKGISTD